jgi:RNA polymerase sigma factor (TIGR02999 family)
MEFTPKCSVAPDNKNNAESSGEVTRLLQRWSDGDATALEALWPLVYDDIRRMAGRQIASERSGHTLQATALVNEAFIRLAGERAFQWQRREQFLALAAQIMRRVLVDYARQRKAQRRGEGVRPVSIHDTWAANEVERAQALDAFHDESIDVLAIDDALTRLQQVRCAPGPHRGTALLRRTHARGDGKRGRHLAATVKREWAMARAWLRRELLSSGAGATP